MYAIKELKEKHSSLSPDVFKIQSDLSLQNLDILDFIL